MKKGINKNVFTIIALVAVLALIAAYFLGYKKYTDLAASTQSSNATLQKEVDALKVHYVNKAKYEADMVPMKEEIHKIMEKYPADTKAEDVIMHAVETQIIAPVAYSSISIGEKKTISSVAQDTVLATAQEDMQQGISFVEQQGTYMSEIESYAGLKGLVQAIFDSEYNLGIRKIAFSKGEEGKLNGSLELSFYSMIGNGVTYEAPDITPYLQGTGNIFGFVQVYVDEEGNIVGAPIEESTEETVEDTTEGTTTEEASAEPAV